MICLVPDCEKPRGESKGYCPMHYARLQRHGNLAGKQPRRPAVDRFPEYVDKTGDCWLWTGAVNNRGYGRFGDDGRIVYAHRWSYEHHIGPIPDGLHVMHSCDVPRCVNPEHLSVGTRLDNMRDMKGKGRGVGSRSTCARGHVLTPENARTRKRNGYIMRECRACVRERSRAA